MESFLGICSVATESLKDCTQVFLYSLSAVLYPSVTITSSHVTLNMVEIEAATDSWQPRAMLQPTPEGVTDLLSLLLNEKAFLCLQAMECSDPALVDSDQFSPVVDVVWCLCEELPD